VTVEVEPEKWHHVVWIGDPAQKRVSLWYDGNYRGSNPSSGRLSPGAGTLGLGMYIGDEDVPQPFGVWQGRLDEVRFYRRPLALGEVVALYREGIAAIAKREEGGNQQPSAVAACEPTAGLPPLTVRFDASDSSDPEKGTLTYAWDFGDGATGTGVTSTRTYAKIGTYAARLTVTDDKGGSATIEKTIRVQNEAPKPEVRAGWDAIAGKGEAAYGVEDIKLDASASVDPEGKPLKFTWTVAGQTYQGAVVRAKLPSSGAHPVTLLADDGTGRTTTWRSVVNRPDADGRSLAETPVGTYTPGLHYRYFHQGGRKSDIALQAQTVFPIEWNVFKHFGIAHAPLPWNSRLRPESYWIDWAGYLEVPADGEYTFHFNVAGGAYFWLGSRPVGNWYQGFGSIRQNQFKDFAVKLQKGKHRFRLVFHANHYSNQNLDLTWSGPGFTNVQIPPTVFTRSLTVAEQQAAGLANPQPGSDVWDWFPESNPSLEVTTPPPATKGKLELMIDGPGADRFMTASVKLPADFVEPVEVVCHPGDGSRLLAREFSLTYPPGAEYTIRVEATDTAGRSATAWRKIVVPAVPAFESIGLVVVRSAAFLRPSTVAGAFPQGFWNSIGKEVQGEKIRDNQGREVALKVSPVDQLFWPLSPVYAARTSSMDDQLLGDSGLLNSQGITLEAIPYDRYDLVIIAPGARSEMGLLEMTLAVGGQTRKVVTARAPSDFDGRYIEETEANPAGNYIVFRGLTGPKQTITVASVKGSKRPAINALQIIRAK
jgi:PKD repeat protein